MPWVRTNKMKQDCFVPWPHRRSAPLAGRAVDNPGQDFLAGPDVPLAELARQSWLAWPRRLAEHLLAEESRASWLARLARPAGLPSPPAGKYPIQYYTKKSAEAPSGTPAQPSGAGPASGWPRIPRIRESLANTDSNESFSEAYSPPCSSMWALSILR